jgi:hypothetical protein
MEKMIQRMTREELEFELATRRLADDRYSSTPIDYEWLQEYGFRKITRQERQSTDHARRCVAHETADEDRFMVAMEDLCIDLAPNRWPRAEFWFCWITRASSQNHFPSVFLHARHLKTQGDLMLLYEGLTGRSFGKPNWDRRQLAPKILLEAVE